MSVKFLHYRAFDDDGRILSHGGVTIAYVAADTGVTYALARCSPQDNFSRAFGRNKARGRLLSEYADTLEHYTVSSFILQMDAIYAGRFYRNIKIFAECNNLTS